MANKEIDIDTLEKEFLTKCEALPKIKVAVVYPTSEDSLKGAIDAAQLGLIEPLLIGPKKVLNNIASKGDIDISPYEIKNTDNSHHAVQEAISMIHDGQADAIMKGNLHTDELMKEVINKASGLRSERRISHVFVFATEKYHKPFIITDAAININPDLITKRDIVQNAVDLVHLLKKNGDPKVAILSAVETINPNIPSTIDAACLCKMADRGQITGAIVDGPFAFDNVISLTAAETKKIKSPVVGDADIFLVPNLEAGNMFAKQLMYFTNTLSAGMILGAKVPIILTSRADGVRSRIGSCALAVMMVAAAKRPSDNVG
ncbi:MAG: bifunctional enoyl-CoA hydratase/phosphate acetyltransferase [Candidatus Berkiellales bacterium]